jgi:polyisoprenoid-binding protein YceI
MGIPEQSLKAAPASAAWRAVAAACVGLIALAASAGEYAMVPERSRLEFAAEQQGADFRGQFRDFTARLQLDAADPAVNSLIADIQLASVDTAYAERDDYLRGEEWFFVERWPLGRFETRSFEPLGGGRYRADAALTLRDQTRPVVMEFAFDGQRLTGEVTLDRREFGVGQGMWADDRMVGAAVTVYIDVQFVAAP